MPKIKTKSKWTPCAVLAPVGLFLVVKVGYPNASGLLL